jgi:hypothetical protein
MTVPVSLNLTRTISSGLRQCGQLSCWVSLTLTSTTTCRTAPINPGSYLWFLFVDRLYQFLFRVQRKTRRREPAGFVPIASGCDFLNGFAQIARQIEIPVATKERLRFFVLILDLFTVRPHIAVFDVLGCISQDCSQAGQRRWRDTEHFDGDGIGLYYGVVVPNVGGGPARIVPFQQSLLENNMCSPFAVRLG